MMHMKRSLTGLLVLGLTAMPSMAGTTITPLEGSLGSPFTEGAVHGWGWSDPQLAGPQIGNLYDNILFFNGGAASGGTCGPFATDCGTQAFIDWTSPTAQWGDDLHGLAGPTLGGPTAVITSIRYGYLNTIASATHTIQIYDMIPPSAGHATNASTQFGDQLMSLVLTGIPTGAAMVTVTGLSVHAGTAAWIKFGESGPGFPGTFWLSGGDGSGPGATHIGILYDNKNYYGPGTPLHQFYYAPWFFFEPVGFVEVNIQVALSGYVLPAPAVISLLGLGGLMSLRRRGRAGGVCT